MKGNQSQYLVSKQWKHKEGPAQLDSIRAQRNTATGGSVGWTSGCQVGDRETNTQGL